MYLIVKKSLSIIRLGYKVWTFSIKANDALEYEENNFVLTLNLGKEKGKNNNNGKIYALFIPYMHVK